MEDKQITEEDLGIFQNQSAVVENIREAAEVVGASTEGLDRLKDGKPLEFMVARKNCTQCWGKGQVDFVPNEHKSIRNTSLREDRFLRSERITKALCRCVKIQME